jgi:prepilin-type N-terminal cleavage/methylation domain-containing protein
MNRNIQNLKKQKGLTLIEISIGIVIAAALLFGLFYLVSVVNDRSTVKDEVQYYNQMTADARTKFRQQGNYTGATAGSLINLGIVPPALVNGVNITSGFGGNVAVAPINLNGAANDGLQLTYTLPRRLCPDFVDGIAGSANRITVDGDIVKDSPANTPTLDVNAMGAACDASAAGNVTVVLASGR